MAFSKAVIEYEELKYIDSDSVISGASVRLDPERSSLASEMSTGPIRFLMGHDEESSDHEASESLISPKAAELAISMDGERDEHKNHNKMSLPIISVTADDDGWESDATEILDGDGRPGGLWMKGASEKDTHQGARNDSFLVQQKWLRQLGKEDQTPHQVHEMFVELYDLGWDPVTGQALWQETARWIKYEEDAEGIDHHWGRPHVAFLSFHALHQLKACLKHGLILLDLEVSGFDDACSQIATAMASKFAMDEQRTNAVLSTLQRKHRHVHEARPIGRIPSVSRNSRRDRDREASVSDFRRMNSTPATNTVEHQVDLPSRKSIGGGEALSRMDKANERGMGGGRSFSPPNLATLAEAEKEDDDWLERRGAAPPPPKESTGSRIKWDLGAHEKDEDSFSLPGLDSENKLGRTAGIGVGSGGGGGGGDRERVNSIGSTKTNMSFSVRFGLGQAFSSIRNMHRSESETGMTAKDVEELMKKIPEGAETAQVFVGVLAELKEARFCMVRLKSGVLMPELLDAPIPIRFLFVILGPAIVDVNYHEIGRSIATLMSNPHFHSMAYTAPNAAQIDAAIDEFLDGSIVIPPGEIDSKQLLSVDEIKKALRRRKNRTVENKARLELRKRRHVKIVTHGKSKNGKSNGKEEEEEKKDSRRRASTTSDTNLKKAKRGDPLKRSGRLFSGVAADIRWRLPWYWTDFKDALNFQCFTSVIFMFFAAFAPAITFGGLMGNYTHDQMGITETLIAQCVCGVIWGFCSAQPLMIMSATGPILIFEYSLYGFCKAMGLPFMPIRVWTGVWVLVIAVVTVMFEGSFLVSYVTPFTEDIFAALISIIFIAESVKFVEKTFIKNPVTDVNDYSHTFQSCMAFVDSANSTTHNDTSPFFNVTRGTLSWEAALVAERDKCIHTHQPDSGLLTTILLVGTFAIALVLKRVRGSYYFGRTIRRGLGDFGVLIAIVVMGLFDNYVVPVTYLERLHMPSSIDFTDPVARGHGLIVNPILEAGQWHGYLFAAVPALLVYILLFVETEITELLLAKKEKGLKKGTGYHWDLLLVGLLCLLCSVFGLPWMCAAAVQSLAHASSLTVMKRHAPGERPSVDHVIEQRVTAIGCSVLVGGCAFLGSFLKELPLATLFGVFLFLGVMNLLPVQLMHRIVLFFIPEKYFPDAPFCQEVGMWRMHLWTGLQVLCLVLVYIVKHFKVTSLAFPFALMLVALFRLFAVPKIFKPKEITALDGHEEAEDDTEEEGFPYSVF